jgi:P27 family predicted phage terminase small subunit
LRLLQLGGMLLLVHRWCPQMQRGPKPQPSNIIRLKNNPGKRRLRADIPAPEPKIPTAPLFLNAVARAEYDRMARELSKLALVSELDTACLAAYAVAFARWCECEEWVQRLGIVVKAPRGGGGMTTNPFLRGANNAMAQMLRCAAELGGSPSARQRLTSGAPSPTFSDPIDQWFS